MADDQQLLSIVNEIQLQLVRGVEKEILDLSEKLEKFRNVLDDADKKQFEEKTVKDWLRRLEETSHEMEDVLEEWNYAIIQHNVECGECQSNAPPRNKVCFFIPSSCLFFVGIVVRREIAKKIQDLKSGVDEILIEKDVHSFVISQPKYDPNWRVQSTSLIDLEEVRGRDHDRDILVNKLVTNGSHEEGLGYRILSIVGGGGLGKTTLAQLVYNDSRVIEYFDFRVWICVSNPFDVAVIAKGILKSINGQSSPETPQLDDLLKDLICSISRKKILLVLDDVWNEQEEKWKPLENALKCGGASTRILVTTRKVKVVGIMGTKDEDMHRPELLSEEDCWLLLRRSALVGTSEDELEYFEKIGKDIAEKCNGLPLAAKTLGSLLRFKNTIQEWENVLKSEVWGLEEARMALFPHFLSSYNELSPMLKRCFSYCAFFRKKKEIEAGQLIRCWMALGYLGSDNMEVKGRECLEDLAMRSLFQDFKRDDHTKEINLDDHTKEINLCKMHDIVHDFAQFLRKSGRVEAPGMRKRSCQVCDPFLVSRVKEYRTLFRDQETPPNLCDCLGNLRVLQLSWKMNRQEMEKLIHLRKLSISSTKLSKEDLATICKLYFLQTLRLGFCGIKEIPWEIGNLVKLRFLDLTFNEELTELPESICSLVELRTLLLMRTSVREIPTGIGNLVRLRHLDLTGSRKLTSLPESMCNLVELRTLNIHNCCALRGLPEGIHKLKNLRHLLVAQTEVSHRRFPRALAELSGLRTLNMFHGGSGCNRLSLLKKLNRLTGSLVLQINIKNSHWKELVEDAREAELGNKTHLRNLYLYFNTLDENIEWSSPLSVDVLEALEPNHNLKHLEISEYKGWRLPYWISSPLNLVREIDIHYCRQLLSLPPMGQLPFLEKLWMLFLNELKVVGREWLGFIEVRRGDIQSSSSSASSSLQVVAFPKLKELAFSEFPKWEEWEDITAEEEECAAVEIMPSLTSLQITECGALKKLPHRLLRKARALKDLYACHLIDRHG